jgi:hypothetical protein
MRILYERDILYEFIRLIHNHIFGGEGGIYRLVGYQVMFSVPVEAFKYSLDDFSKKYLKPALTIETELFKLSGKVPNNVYLAPGDLTANHDGIYAKMIVKEDKLHQAIIVKIDFVSTLYPDS